MLWKINVLNRPHFLNFTEYFRPNNDAANIIMLFTDGFPTSGPVTHWPTIRDRFTENNKVNNIFLNLKVLLSIFTFWDFLKSFIQDDYAFFGLAIGSAAPYADMDRMAQLNHGATRQVFDGLDVPDQMKDFYNGIANPLIWNFRINYSNANGVAVS